MKRIQIELPVFFAKKNKLVSNFCEIVKVVNETPKSFEVLLQPVCQPASACWKCGKTITNSSSQAWGLGPDCATTMGLPWNDPPHKAVEFLEENRVSIFLPKTFLDQRQVAELQSIFNIENDGETTAANSMEGELVKSDGLLKLTTSEINGKFISDLRSIDSFKVGGKGESKYYSFDFDEETFMNVYSRLLAWKLIVKLDNSCAQLATRAQGRISASQKSLKEISVDTVQEIKYAQLDVAAWDWGLNPTSVPWLHQAQGILFAAAVMGIAVPPMEVDQ